MHIVIGIDDDVLKGQIVNVVKFKLQELQSVPTRYKSWWYDV